jgi:hypothetical protein
MSSLLHLTLVCALVSLLDLIAATPLNTGAVTFREHRVYQVSLPINYDQFDQYLRWTSTLKSQSIEPISLEGRSAENDLLGTEARPDHKRAYLDSLLDKLETAVPLDHWSRNESGSVFMIPPDYQPLVDDYLLNNSLHYQVLIDDVQQLIDQEKVDNLSGQLSGRTGLDEFSFEKYHPYEKVSVLSLFLSRRSFDTFIFQNCFQQRL